MQLPSKKKIILGSILGIIFYSVVYYYAANSEAFLSTKQELLLSEKLIAEVGEIQKVELPIYGSFKSKSFTSATKSTASAIIKVKVTGALKSLTLVVTTKRENGVWKIQSAKHDGRLMISGRTKLSD